MMEEGDGEVERIRLVVDLAFTPRYYNATTELIPAGIEYRKIPVCNPPFLSSSRSRPIFHHAGAYHHNHHHHAGVSAADSCAVVV